MRVLVLNGPKESGKDFGSDFLSAHRYGCVNMSFKRELIRETCNHYNVSEDWFKSVSNDRDSKETPFPELGGLSPRGALIHVSEDIVKPIKGVEYFGEALTTSILKAREEGIYTAIISDGGVCNQVGEKQVWAELNPLIRTFGNDLTVVQVYRPGHTFEGDTRRYFGKGHFDFSYGEEFPLNENDIFTINTLPNSVRVGTLHNSGSLEDLQYNLLAMYDDVLGGLE